jgi:sugar lactone lactonase YvrE
VTPLRAAAGGRVVLHGSGFPVDPLPRVTVAHHEARVTFASSSRIIFVLPPGLDAGQAPIRVGDAPGETPYLQVGGEWATGLHQVDNPLIDAAGNVYVTYSGARGQESPVSIFKVTPAGTREPFVSGIVNATSMTFGPDGHLYVSSRFDGAVYRVNERGEHAVVVSDLGVACGLAFGPDGSLYVGDRSGTIFRVRDGRAALFATLPPSIAAFHLAASPSGELFVSGPTLSAYDHVYRIGADGQARAVLPSFGRPQGLAFSPEDGVLHVVEALAGRSGVYRLRDLESTPELVIAGDRLIGVAFGAGGGMAVASNDTVWRFESSDERPGVADRPSA